MKCPYEIEDIDALITNRKKFDEFVYTPLEKARQELEKRWNDKNIETFPFIPDILKDGFKALLYVAVITPNHQIRRYVDFAKKINLDPIVFEQQKDKFTSNNEWKYALGKLHFCLGKDKNNKTRIEFLNVIDFNQSNGKSINSLKTFWGQSLIDFHHEMYFGQFPHLKEKNVFEASDWFLKHGSTPIEYYKSFLSLLIKHAIQFENFMLHEKEISFTKEVFLPAFIGIYKKTGLKPLIVALQPTEIEDDQYWISYPHHEKDFVLNKMKENKL